MDNFDKLFGRTLQKVKAEFAERTKKASECNITLEDLYLVATREQLRGQAVDMSAVNKYEELKKAAEWLDANCYETTSFEVDPPDTSKPHAGVSVEFRRISFIRGKTMDVLLGMWILANSVFVRATTGNGVKLFFNVEHMWSK